ncbi:hypothetical protein SteCoe_21518 [Stentor coeruleus]|uniref:Uncharacterized protein n=1 Tax=Stentor coeruleus TaxID=5963 RepID=A0A1R2BPF5_9CILI|nr:hypothetical protein SteCoe_21518 [Stentor coeruleus]
MDITRSPTKTFRPDSSASTKFTQSISQSPIDFIFYNEISRSPQQYLKSNNCSMRDMKNSSPDKFINNHHRACSIDTPIINLNRRKTIEAPIKNMLLKDNIKMCPKQRQRRKKSRKTSMEEIYILRDLRCKALNNLMNACSKVESSKEIHQAIDSEKRTVNSWSKAVDEVTHNIRKINDCNPEIVHHLYYYNKFSNEEIYKEIKKLKNKKDQPIIISGRHKF